MKIVTASALQSYFIGCLAGYRILADVDYACPTEAWLAGPFWDWFKKTRWDLGLTRWTRYNDCDNFARAYAQAAQDCFALTPWPGGAERPEGLAVGEFFYHSSNGPHAICVALADSDDLTFIEPQTGHFLPLSPEEKRSCFFVRF